MKNLLLLAFLATACFLTSCGDDEPEFSEDNLAGTWLLVTSDGTSVSTSNVGGGMSTTNSEFTLLSSDFQLTFARNPNVVTGQAGEFTLETMQSTDGGTATTTTQVMTTFTSNEADWSISGKVLTFTYQNGETESHFIEELNSTTLRLRQDTTSEIDIAGATVATESSTTTVFERG